MTRRYLVCADYGMGALWWWIRAESADEISDTLADVEVVEEPNDLRQAESWNLDEFDLADAAAGPLKQHAEEREKHRRDPSFGQLLGKERVYLCMADPSVDLGQWYSEHDKTGRRLRQVELRADGSGEATTEGDLPFNPPFDLRDPQYGRAEITREQFEDVWRRATGNG